MRGRDSDIEGGIRFRLQARDLLGIAQGIAERNGVLLDDLLGTRRLRAHVAARHAFWHYLWAERSMSGSAIARLWGGCTDHTAILHGIDAHLNRQPREKKEAKEMPELSPITWDRASLEEYHDGVERNGG